MRVHVSAPGRICLFGEHQDYLGLPVAASAINLRCHLRSTTREDRWVELHLLDLDEVHRWDLDSLPKPRARAYWLAGLHVAKKEGWLPDVGWTCEVTSAIPQQAGASSSSALTVAWCALMAARSKRPWDAEWVAQAAWRVEVDYFNEPGGMMDHAVCATGGVQCIHFSPEFHFHPLPTPQGEWLLLNSLEPKDTLAILQRAKHRRLQLLDEWGVDVRNAAPMERPGHWKDEDHRLMDATMGIREVSGQGMRLLEVQGKEEEIGPKLTAHHRWLAEGLAVSTPCIDRLLSDALEWGAHGGKINGSGGGGTAFAVFSAGGRARAVQEFRSRGVELHAIALGEEGVRIEAFAED